MVTKNELFTTTFKVTDIDPQGKVFDKVSRLVAFSETYGVELIVDINTEIYPLAKGDSLTLLLATTLSSDGTLQDPFKKQSWTDHAKQQDSSLADQYDYVMYGKVYKFDDKETKATVYASFGGLLMNLSGDFRYFDDLEVGMNVYLLIRK